MIMAQQKLDLIFCEENVQVTIETWFDDQAEKMTFSIESVMLNSVDILHIVECFKDGLKSLCELVQKELTKGD